jgi:hypothetical protein
MSGHVESLHNGRMVGPGEDVTGVDPKHPHDKRLIDRGVLVKRARKQSARTTGAKPAAEPQKEDNK